MLKNETPHHISNDMKEIHHTTPLNTTNKYCLFGFLQFLRVDKERLCGGYSSAY